MLVLADEEARRAEIEYENMVKKFGPEPTTPAWQVVWQPGIVVEHTDEDEGRSDFWSEEDQHAAADIDAVKPTTTQEVIVQLTGEDGNVFAIIGRVRRALERAGFRAEAAEFVKKATSGDLDYNGVLALAMDTVDVR
jgi:hypothetical protein